jgi:triosephosphate isomerase
MSNNSRKTIIAGNWKMNGSRANNAVLVDEILSGMGGITSDIIICPPSLYVNEIAAITSDKSIKVGAQNLNLNQSGAFTGEISGTMIKDCGANFVIVGHSERRSLYGETDEIAAEKVKIALDSGLIPIFCIGEELSERENGTTNDVLKSQMDAVFNTIDIENFENIIIAYEPVWAIGTGVVATPQQAQETHKFVRSLIAGKNTNIAENISILYGGSMNPTNAKELLACEDIDGGLIGGASLKAQDFLAICKSV